ncbi:hypothetical protein D1BOALGB6SA_3656 [Olavius sp. associated proteobacterium Delta 1]|nr:hypothetical protein D1BOALGB6SA_3656 [Olavius sp. associated proteobacterium Delta 1]
MIDHQVHDDTIRFVVSLLSWCSSWFDLIRVLHPKADPAYG